MGDPDAPLPSREVTDEGGTEPFSVGVHRGETSTAIVLAGEVDLAARDAIADALAEAIREPVAPRLLVDLRDVTFIDSSGLSAAIVLAARAADSAGISFTVVPGPGVIRALEVSGLDQFVAPSADD
jgi:anti-anti-sigma factor